MADKRYFIDDTQPDDTSPPAPAPTGSPRPAVTGAPAPAGAAFDRPRPVVITGPRPLPVALVGGPSGAPAPFAGPGAPAPYPFTAPKPEPVRGPAPRATDAFRLLGEEAAAAGRGAMGVAGNDGAAAFSGAVGVATAGLSRLGPYGMAAAAGLQAAATGANAFRETVGAFAARARELSGMNGLIAGASARVDANRYLSDVRESERLGPQLAKIIENQDKLDATQRELLLPIKEFLLNVLNGAIEGGLGLFVELIQTTRDGIAAAGAFPAVVARIDDTLRRIKEIIEGGGTVDPLANWLDALAGFAGPPGPAARGPIGRPVPVPPAGPPRV